MKGVAPGPWPVARAEISSALVWASRGLEVVNGVARALYARGVLTVHRAGVPMISVGNIAMGGTGKTPLVAALAAALLRSGARPAVLTRGYGRRASRPRVVLHQPSAAWEEIGDEPALLARALPDVPIVVDADRVRGAATAIAQTRATHLILDDGYQHWRLARDLDVVTLDSEDPPCDRRMRREHPRALANAHVAVVIDACPSALAAARALLTTYAPAMPLFPCRLRATGVAVGDDRKDVAWLRGRKVLAFAGIAAPQRFAATLAALGAEVVELMAFPDHHVYRQGEMASLLGRADALGLTPITTAKDAVKLEPPDAGKVAWLAVELVPDGGDFLDLLSPVLQGSPTRGRERLESRP